MCSLIGNPGSGEFKVRGSLNGSPAVLQSHLMTESNSVLQVVAIQTVKYYTCSHYNTMGERKMRVYACVRAYFNQPTDIPHSTYTLHIFPNIPNRCNYDSLPFSNLLPATHTHTRARARAHNIQPHSLHYEQHPSPAPLL